MTDLTIEFLKDLQRRRHPNAPHFGVEGYTDTDIDQLEERLGSPVPADLRFALKNCRDDTGRSIFAKLPMRDDLNASYEWVWHGIDFDIRHNTTWLKRWGKKPLDIEQAVELARIDFETWPKLIALYGHRFLPLEPNESGNPVFSIMQTDIIYYGTNLASYLENEFT